MNCASLHRNMQRTINAMKELIFESVGEKIFGKQNKDFFYLEFGKFLDR